MALRVAFDAAPLLGARTGIGVATAGLLEALATRPELAFTAYGLTGTGWADLRRQLPAGVRPARAPLPAGPALRLWGRADHPAIEWWVGRVDVVHGTNFVVPPARRAARVVTVADLTAVHLPELCTPTARRYPGLVARAVTAGAWVHTFAASVAGEVVEHLGADPARVRVVPPGLDQPPSAPAAPALPGPPAAPDRAARPGAPYVLALGTVEPRKDLPSLVRAFDALAAGRPDLELHLVGADGWGAAALDAAVAAARHRDRIRRRGWVADPAAELAGAAVLAYPSVYEGFGLPPLEAMAAGVPVVATAAGSVPEVVGDAAALVPVGDTDALAAALATVLDDPDRAAAMVAAGRRRAGSFTWAAAAAGMAALYADAARG